MFVVSFHARLVQLFITHNSSCACSFHPVEKYSQFEPFYKNNKNKKVWDLFFVCFIVCVAHN